MVSQRGTAAASQPSHAGNGATDAAASACDPERGARVPADAAAASANHTPGITAAARRACAMPYAGAGLFPKGAAFVTRARGVCARPRGQLLGCAGLRQRLPSRHARPAWAQGWRRLAGVQRGAPAARAARRVRAAPARRGGCRQPRPQPSVRRRARRGRAPRGRRRGRCCRPRGRRCAGAAAEARGRRRGARVCRPWRRPRRGRQPGGVLGRRRGRAGRRGRGRGGRGARSGRRWRGGPGCCDGRGRRERAGQPGTAACCRCAGRHTCPTPDHAAPATEKLFRVAVQDAGWQSQSMLARLQHPVGFKHRDAAASPAR
jgi:hypothetical protein